MIDFEQEQQSRPEFESVAYERESPVTGKPEKYFPSEKRFPVLVRSAAISSTFIVTVACAIISIYIFKVCPAPLSFSPVGTRPSLTTLSSFQRCPGEHPPFVRWY